MSEAPAGCEVIDIGRHTYAFDPSAALNNGARVSDAHRWSA
jgi:hypothetical protein